MATGYKANLAGVDPRDFLIDSGATTHVANSLDLFNEYVSLPADRSDQVVTGAGPLPVHGYGNVEVVDDNSRSYTLKQVMYVPECPVNLLSSIKINREGGELHIYPSNAYIVTPDGKALESSRAYKGIYLLAHNSVHEVHHSTMGSGSKAEKSATWWHAAFGHVGMKTLHKLFMNASVLGMSVAQNTWDLASDCIACVKVKFKRSSFKSVPAPTAPLEQVHSDLSGPHPPGLNDHKYICVVRDKYSGYTMAKTLAEKSEAGSFIKYCINHWERTSEYRVKSFRTDGGGEFLDSNLRKWFEEKGIAHGITAPESSASNGAAERVILTIFDRVRAALVETNQPRPLWPWLVGHIVTAMNYVPYNEHTISPHEIIYGVKPDVSYLRPFGTAVAAWNPTQSRHDKLEPRASVGRLVGYHPDSTSMYQVIMMLCTVCARQGARKQTHI